MTQYTIQQIAERVGGRLLGAGNTIIKGVDQLDRAGPDQISFIRDHRHAQGWAQSSAAAALVMPGLGLEVSAKRPLVEVQDSDLALALVLEMFAPPQSCPSVGVHPSAVVSPTALVHDHAIIGPGCVIGDRVQISNLCVLHANVTVLDDSVLASGCILYPGVILYDRSKLGKNVVVHANAVLGCDGFGYRPASDGSGHFVKIPQIGSVVVGDNVEIGAGTCIDRGKFSTTTIGDGTKIDNLCQIAHNCQIGRNCILAGQVGLAGSVTIEDGAVLGGQVGVVDHITIGAGAKLAGGSIVAKDVPSGATWHGHPACDIRTSLRQIASLNRLPGLMKKLKSQDKPNLQD